MKSKGFRRVLKYYVTDDKLSLKCVENMCFGGC